MFQDKTLKSKSFWVGVLTVGFGIFQLTQGNTAEAVAEIQAGLLIICGRDAIAKIQK